MGVAASGICAALAFAAPVASADLPVSKKFIQDSAAVSSAFGSSVDTANGWAFIGAPTTDIGGDSGLGKGKVFVYHRTARGTWQAVQTLQPTGLNVGASFGRSVSASANGRRLVVGASGKDLSETCGRSGAVYLYTAGRDGKFSLTKTFEGTCVSPYGVGTGLGFSVAMNESGSTFAAGAPGDPVLFGSVHVFSEGTDGWKRRAVETIGGSDDRGGYSVEINDGGSSVIAGAPFDDTLAGGEDAGSVIVWDWKLKGSPKKVLFGPPRADAKFGFAVAMQGSGGRIAVGAPGGAYGPESFGSVVTLYKRSWLRLKAKWGDLKKGASIAPTPIREPDCFGCALSFNAAGLAVGDMYGRAEGDAFDVFDQNGAAYLYRMVGGTPILSQVLFNPDNSSNTGDGDQFGRAVALDDYLISSGSCREQNKLLCSRVLVGAPYDSVVRSPFPAFFVTSELEGTARLYTP